MRCLVFGSSARRGATGWTDAAAIRALLLTALPDVVIHGASPAGGADRLAHDEARALDLRTPIRVEPCPVDTAVDGPWPGAGMRRNARMHREKRLDVAAGFISGKVGTPLSSGSACMAGICERAGTPLVLYREDGYELRGDLRTARAILLGLHRAAPWAREDITRAGLAVRAALDGGDALAAWSAVETLRVAQPRLVPWVQVVEGLVRRAG